MSPTSTRSASMMPFALDLISTFVIGSTFPVATTDFTIVPRSTVARADGSKSRSRALRAAEDVNAGGSEDGDAHAIDHPLFLDLHERSSDDSADV